MNYRARACLQSSSDAAFRKSQIEEWRGSMVSLQTRPRIVRDPRICGGEPVIRGTRVTLRTVLASLAEGDSIESILEDFPVVF